MLIKNTLLYVLSKGGPGILSFLGLALFTRMLSPEEYGQYATVIAVIGLINVGAFQWLRLSLGRFLYSKIYSKQRLFSLIVSLFLFVSLAIFILCVAVGYLFDLDDVTIKVVFVSYVLLITQAWFEMNLSLCSASLKPKEYGYMNLAKVLLSLIVTVVFLTFGLSYYSLLLGAICGAFFSLVVFGRKRWIGVNVSVPAVADVRNLIVYGVPLTGTYMLSWVNSSSDRLLISGMIGIESAGTYSVGYDLSQNTITMLLVIVSLAAGPLAFKSLEKGGESEAVSQLRQNGSLIFTIAFSSTIVLVLLSDYLVDFLIGEEFRSSAKEIVPIIAVSAMVSGVRSFYFDQAFFLGKWTSGQLIVVSFAAGANLALNFVLIPIMGIIGAAYSTLISYLLALIFSIKLGRRSFLLPDVFPMLYKPFLVSIVTAIFCLVGVNMIDSFKLLAGFLLSGFGFLIGIVALNIADVRSIILGRNSNVS